MSEETETIINGIDVSECRYYNNGKCRIPHYQQGIKYVSCNCNEWDCIYKQLKRLQQENEGLKEVLKDIRDIIKMPKYTCKEFLYIKGKINEVLNDRN